MKTREIALALILGVLTNLVAAAMLEFGHEESARIVLIAATLTMTAIASYTLYQLRVLNKVGFRKWESSVNAGTTTKDCIDASQKSIDFLGIAATKWTDEGDHFRKMLVRHASNGGSARFLLINPFGPACADFETIKRRPAGSLRKIIIDNAQELLRLRNTKLPINVRFYEGRPHFRVTVVDHIEMLLGLYSYSTDDGQGGPQLIFDGRARTWSFYYAFCLYFERLWAASEPAQTVLERLHSRRKEDGAI